MADALFIIVGVLYFFVGTSLFIYGLSCYFLTGVAWWHGRGGSHRPKEEVVTELDEWPLVTVQIPVYNEMYVAERIINAVAQFDYPRERLQIQLLDDSTDETVEIVRAAVRRWRAAGVAIEHVHRVERMGFKAGALQAGLETARGEFIAMFDADFVPPADYLRRTIPCFRPETAFVQARWSHLNADYSLLTMLQGVTLDAHFMIEHFARWARGLWFNFNGTAGVWRRSALDDAGGWQADTLTEDLDMSYRAMLRGWEAEYVREVAVPAELPVSINSLRRQQHRWARGSMECALKLLPQIWRSAVPLRFKVAALLHLSGYVVHLLILGLVVLYPAVLYLSESYEGLINLYGIALVFSVTALAPPLFFLMGQRLQGRPWWRWLAAVLFVTAAGSGLMVNTLRAALQIVTKRQAVFERTAKFGIQRQRERWFDLNYQLNVDGIVWVELFFAAVNVGTVIYAIYLDHWGVAFYATLFGLGLFYVAGVTIWQAVGLFWHRLRRRGPVFVREQPELGK